MEKEERTTHLFNLRKAITNVEIELQFIKKETNNLLIDLDKFKASFVLKVLGKKVAFSTDNNIFYKQGVVSRVGIDSSVIFEITDWSEKMFILKEVVVVQPEPYSRKPATIEYTSELPISVNEQDIVDLILK